MLPGPRQTHSEPEPEPAGELGGVDDAWGASASAFGMEASARSGLSGLAAPGSEPLSGLNGLRKSVPRLRSSCARITAKNSFAPRDKGRGALGGLLLAGDWVGGLSDDGSGSFRFLRTSSFGGRLDMAALRLTPSKLRRIKIERRPISREGPDRRTRRGREDGSKQERADMGRGRRQSWGSRPHLI
ncbi:hypothetical protein GW17_00020924 [Ensete ventricosum]|nr:hypothetical protein GW17_00020924 [Ensete ventricosum]